MNYNNDFTCARRFSSAITITRAANWEFGTATNAANRSGLVIGENKPCGDGAWMAQAWGKLGYSDPTQVLLDLGYTKLSPQDTNGITTFKYYKAANASYEFPPPGAVLNTADVKDGVWRIFKEKYGDVPRLNDNSRFYIYNNAYTSPSGCNGKKLERYDANNELQQARIVEEELVHFYDLDGIEYIWSQGRGLGSDITTGYDLIPGQPDQFEQSCKMLVEKMSGNAGRDLAKAYANFIAANPDAADSSTRIGGGSTSTGDSACGYGNSALNWIACPLTTLMQEAATKVADMLQGLLYFPTDAIFNSGTLKNADFKEAWSSFRNIGLALVIIAGLVMVISQALGLQILDAYTIRKLMPRLAIAMIGISLSWPILNFAISFFNDIGSWTRSLIIAPFDGMPLANSGGTNVLLNWGALFIGGPAFLLYLSLLGPLASLSLLGTLLLAIIVGLITLAIRWVIIALCILFAPLAIAAYVLPGTQKLWSFWKTTFISSLVMFPIIMGLLAAGEVMARVATAIEAGNYLFILLLYFGPYFLLPLGFKLAGGLLSTIFSLANDKSKGVFDRMSNFRQNSRKQRFNEYAQARRGEGIVAQTAAYARAAGDPGVGIRGLISKHGRQAIRTSLSEQAAAEARKNDVLHSTDDDFGLRAAHDVGLGVAQGRVGKSRGEMEEHFVSTYLSSATAAGRTRSRDDALRALAELEAGLKTQLGSGTMTRVAGASKVQSKTVYGEGEAGMREMLQDVEDMVQAGLWTDAQATATIKQAQRQEFSSISHGDLLTKFHELRASNGGQGRAVTMNDASQMYESAVTQMQFSSLAGARKETIEGVAKHLQARYQGAIRADGSIDEDEEKKIMADIASFREAVNYYNSENKDLLADYLASQPSGYTDPNTGATISIRQREEQLRASSDPIFMDRRKEWDSRQGQMVGQPGGPQGTGPGQPGPQPTS
ncbi:hypothetical protein IPL85_01995 [Candidatus Saccharibacteria bacterium]|nr:MAG: hypothetical protein IPL85_01995 [Candidatus Saccharibacteria bacterium]